MITTAREEQYLAKFAGEDVPIPEPKTRAEMYLAKMAGMDVDPPAPITREEQILSAIAENGGGGGGGSSDFSTATVTISNATRHSINTAIPYIDSYNNDIEALIYIDIDAIVEHTIPLYKGRATMYFELNTESIALTGDLTDEGDGCIIVTGDGTITISRMTS